MGLIKEEVSGREVANEGTILPFGILKLVKVWDKKYPKPLSYASSGILVWSFRLEKYDKNPFFFAEMDIEKKEVIVSKERVLSIFPSKEIERIPFEDLDIVFISKYLVNDDRFLINLSLTEEQRKYLNKKLSLADKGMDPGYYDNSIFVRVSSDTKPGSIMARITNGQKTLAVYNDSLRKRVYFSEYKPLSYKLWGKEEDESESIDSGKIINLYADLCEN